MKDWISLNWISDNVAGCLDLNFYIHLPKKEFSQFLTYSSSIIYVDNSTSELDLIMMNVN